MPSVIPKLRAMPPVVVFSRTCFWCVPLLACLAVLGAGCSKQQAAPAARPATPVVVGKVESKTMPVEVSSVGNVEAISTVSIKAQVAGELEEVRFKEGDFVRKDQVLLVIDPRPYQAALAQAQAALARDKAVAVNDRAQAERYKTLQSQGVVAASDADTYISAADAADAVVNADQAAIQAAQLNLEYCTINSPIDGRTGVVMLKAGNLVKVADVPIVVINQVNPIYVNFTVPQEYWPNVKERMAQGALKVTAIIPQDSGPPVQGDLTFVDNAVDAATGTLHIRATFQNADNRLWPGLFVNTILTLSNEPNATVVPAQAISSGQNGSFVFVVKGDKTVEQRTVETSRSLNNETVVTKGLQPGETIVLDGQVNLTSGARIEVKNPTDAASGSGPAKTGHEKED
jgi:multidrug efflux system membrane fusion protein